MENIFPKLHVEIRINFIDTADLTCASHRVDLRQRKLQTRFSRYRCFQIGWKDRKKLLVQSVVPMHRR